MTKKKGERVQITKIKNERGSILNPTEVERILKDNSEQPHANNLTTVEMGKFVDRNDKIDSRRNIKSE